MENIRFIKKKKYDATLAILYDVCY